MTLSKGAGSRRVGRKRCERATGSKDWSFLEELVPAAWVLFSWRCNAGVVTVGDVGSVVLAPAEEERANANGVFPSSDDVWKHSPKTGKPLAETRSSINHQLPSTRWLVRLKVYT